MNELEQFMEKNPALLPFGFISPDGIFFYSGYIEYYTSAEEICEWHNYDWIKNGSSIETLKQYGWVCIRWSNVSYDPGLKIDFNKEQLTPQQNKCLQPFIKKYHNKLDLNSKRQMSKEFSEYFS